MSARYVPWTTACLCALLLLDAASVALAQSQTTGEYYRTCERLGFIPGTMPMRRCIQQQRAIDLDPMSALQELGSTGSGTPQPPPGARRDQSSQDRSIDQLIEQSPESLLLGPDHRPPGQGIYE